MMYSGSDYFIVDIFFSSFAISIFYMRLRLLLFDAPNDNTDYKIYYDFEQSEKKWTPHLFRTWTPLRVTVYLHSI